MPAEGSLVRNDQLLPPGKDLNGNLALPFCHPAADSLRRVGREMTKLVPSAIFKVKSKGGPGLAFETGDPPNQFPLETLPLLFVIPSSRLAEASRESNDKACALCNSEG